MANEIDGSSRNINNTRNIPKEQEPSKFIGRLNFPPQVSKNAPNKTLPPKDLSKIASLYSTGGLSLQAL